MRPWSDTDDPFNPGGNTDPSPKPPAGDFDNTSDPIDVSQLPVLSAVDTRFISLFKPDLTQLQSLATYMWGANFDLETFKKLFNDPMAAILGLSIVPVVPPTAAAAPITLGNITTTISMPKITSQYVQVPCGTLNVNEYWGAYLDYSPFTKLEIYLPYIGVQTLDADDIMGRSVEVVSLLCYGQIPLSAHLVGKILHKLQILARIMQFAAVLVIDGVGDQMDVNVILILMNGDKCLVSFKPSVSKFPAKIKSLFVSYGFVLVEGNNVVAIHPAVILLPDFLFFKERLIHGIPG